MEKTLIKFSLVSGKDHADELSELLELANIPHQIFRDARANFIVANYRSREIEEFGYKVVKTFRPRLRMTRAQLTKNGHGGFKFSARSGNSTANYGRSW